MTFRSSSLCLALGLGLGGMIAAPAAAQNPSGAAHADAATTQGSSARLRTLIDAALANDRLDFEAAERLYAGAVVAEDLGGVYGRLDELAAGADTIRACRIAVLKAVLEWRDGDINAATDTVSAALDRRPSTDALILRGRLLDIQNQAGAASIWYERARAQSDNAQERAFLDRRLAIIGVTGRKPDALSQLAGSGDALFASRAAAVLGLLGRSGDAAALYGPRSESGALYGDAVRLADWTIGQGAPDAAAASAWRAAEAAETTEDRLYALALVVEAYRMAGDLAGAELFLAQRPRGPELDQTRLDILLELRRYDDALAMVQLTGDPALRERLLGVLRATGRTAEVEAEHRRLIREAPADPRWADGLAALYLAQGKVDQAVEVYRNLAVANRSHPDVQIKTARKMIAMGLGDHTSQILGDAAAAPALAVTIRRFEVEAAIDQGREAEAEAGLRAFVAAGQRDPALLVAAAEDYERLGRQDLALETLLGVEAKGEVLDDAQQAQVADLAFAAGRPAEALSRWRLLWARTQLPARRVFLQRQIIRAAQLTNQLETIAAELEGRITSGAADQGEVSLLVEIRIAQADGAGAERALHRYAERSRSGEVTTLEQLAAVQARLRNYAGLNASLARLAQVDPTHADDYLRRLILNVLRFPDPAETAADRNRRIDELMAQTRAAGRLDEAEAARFAAAIYTSGHRPDEALIQHQRALALAPSDVDALLEYAAARKARGEVVEAANLLQFKAETALTETAFVAAVSGLLDVLAPGNANRVEVPADLSLARLGWARRAALERILQDGDDLRLSTLVGDIGQDRADSELRLRALQASLAVAGNQKPAVLRQLVSLTSASDAGAGDPVRAAIFGRRLVAMRKPYPPEVYSNLAQMFLKEGDVAGAERAFALMGDMGGLVNLDALRGEAYAEAGMMREALASFRLALLRDQENLDLIARTAVLMERSGAASEASALYWRGLNSLVRRQLTHRTTDGTKALDVAQFAPTLIEGALLTWPAGETQTRLGQWRQTVQAVASTPSSGDATTANLADFPRLGLIAAVNQRLAAFLDDQGLVGLQATLLEPFREDAAARRTLADLTPATGVTETLPDGAWPVADLRRRADANGDFDLGLVLAFEAVDRARIRTLTEAAIAADVVWRVERERGVTRAQPPMLISLLLKAAHVSQPEVIREDVLAPLSLTPFNDLILYDVYRVDPGGFAKLEAAAGRRLLADDVLIRLLVSRGNDPLPVAGGAARAPGGATPLELMARRFDADRLIELYSSLVERLEQTGAASGLQDAIAVHLLASPLDPAQRTRLQAVLIRDISAERPSLPNSGASFVPWLLQLDAPMANRDMLVAGARALSLRYADSARLPDVLVAWFANDRARAFEALISLTESLEHPLQSTLTLLEQGFGSERDAAFQAFLATPRPTREETARFEKRFLRGEAGKTPTDPRVSAAYAKLVSVEPGNGAYVAARLYVQAVADDYQGFVATAAPFFLDRSDDQVVGTLLGLAYRLTGDPAAAALTAEAASVDLDDPEWISQLVSRAAARRSGDVDLLNAFELVWAAYQQRFPRHAAVHASAVQEPELTPTAAAARPLDQLVAAKASGAALGDGLRGLWRSTVPRGRQDFDNFERQALIDSLADPAAAGYGADVVAVVARDPAVTVELERELAALSPGMQARQMRLYARVAAGLWSDGTGQARLDALAAKLAGPPIKIHDLALFLALEKEASVALDADRLTGLTHQLRVVPSLSTEIRLAAAGAYGRAGESAVAAGLMRAALMQSLYPANGDNADPGDPPLDAEAISGALARFADQVAARRTSHDLADLVDREAASSIAARFAGLRPAD